MIEIPIPVRADLDRGIRKTYLDTVFATEDDKAHRFDVALYRGNETVTLPSGASVSAYFIRYCDNGTLPLTGVFSGNVASVTLTKACYNKSGAFALIIKVIENGVTSTVFYGEGSMFVSRTDVLIDDENIIPSLDELLAMVAVMENATAEATTATGNATKAAQNANTATTNANNATSHANTAAAKIDGMTVSAVRADEAAAVISEVDGVKHIAFSLPKGDKGDRGEKGETGSLENMPFYEGLPAALGTASKGTSEMVARGDHVHPLPSASDVGARPKDWMPTAEETGARPNTWVPTAEQVGARPNDWHPVEIFAVGSEINIVHGSVNMTADSVDQVVSQSVDFGFTFAEPPIVIVNLKAVSPDDRFPSFGNVTTTGMTIYGSRKSTKYVNIPVSWVAIGKRQTVIVEEV